MQMEIRIHIAIRVEDVLDQTIRTLIADAIQLQPNKSAFPAK